MREWRGDGPISSLPGALVLRTTGGGVGVGGVVDVIGAAATTCAFAAAALPKEALRERSSLTNSRSTCRRSRSSSSRLRSIASRSRSTASSEDCTSSALSGAPESATIPADGALFSFVTNILETESLEIDGVSDCVPIVAAGADIPPEGGFSLPTVRDGRIEVVEGSVMILEVSRWDKTSTPDADANYILNILHNAIHNEYAKTAKFEL